MKRMLLAIMAVAVAISFSAPSFAGEGEKPKDGEKGKKKETHMIYSDDMGKKKPEDKDKTKK